MTATDLYALLRKMAPERDPRSYDSAEQLYRKLPVIYSQEDGSDDLKNFLGGFGVVLDQIRRTLNQRLRDISPLTCQPWLLPYFADLLDVRPLSPEIDGQRQEIARAVQWRQRKGTVSVCIEIAEAVGQAPIVGFEGHESVARTPRPGYRQRTMRELGEAGVLEPDPATPSQLATRPGTPAVTVDFQKRSQPRRTDADTPTPLTRRSRFDSEEVFWQHENAPHGLPCHRGGYPDIAMRTVDMRDPTWAFGHHHPKRFRLYMPVPEGFVNTGADTAVPAAVAHAFLAPREPPGPTVEWIETHKGETQDKLYLVRRDSPIPDAVSGDRHYVRIEERLCEAGAARDDNQAHGLRIRSTLLTLPEPNAADLDDMRAWESNWSGNGYLFHIITGIRPQEESADVTVAAREPQLSVKDWDTHWNGNGFVLQWERYFAAGDGGGEWRTVLRGGTWDVSGRRPGIAGHPVAGRDHLLHPVRWPALTGDLEIPRPVAAESHAMNLEQLTLTGRTSVEAEHVTLSRTGAKTLVPTALAGARPRVTATDSLLHELVGATGIVTLEYCTVGNPIACEELRTSDCILLGTLTPAEAPKLKLRYSCAPLLDRSAANAEWVIHEASVHTRWPELHHQKMTGIDARVLDVSQFGEPGYGVLRQSSHPSIRQGAEDGGELGAFHHRRYCGRQDAVEVKLREFLPVGMLPVVIVDEYWLPPMSR